MVERSGVPGLEADALRIQPLARAETIPSGWYVDPRFHDLDREALFSTTWQYVGPEAQVATPGDYLLAHVAENPIVVVRDKEGQVRAFYNVCRHRGGPLVMDACGHTNVLQCKYHGWTYLLDGSLRGVPKFDRVDLFDRKDYGLVPALVRSWQGLLFVCLSEAPIPLETVLEGITDRIAPIQLNTLSFARRVTYDIACNWKVYVDNYLEGYHVPLVHPELCDLLDYRHYVTETAPWYSLQYSPIQAEDTPYGSAAQEAFYYFVFPNFALNIMAGRLQTNIILPLSHDRTRVHFDYFYDEVTSPEAQQRIEKDGVFSDFVQQQDMEICEFVQRGLQSRAYDQGRFSVEAEEGVYHFQCLLKEAYQQAVHGT